MEQAKEYRVKPLNSGTISDVLRHILFLKEEDKYGKINVDVKTIEEWISIATDVALDVFPSPKLMNSRQIEITEMRRAIIAAAFIRFQGELPISKLYNEIGANVARTTMRNKPLDRTTIMHAIKMHNRFISMPKMYSDYYVNFSYLCRCLREKGML